MNKFTKIMASPVGRGIRVIAGSGVVAYGLLSVGGANGLIIACVGALPIFTGLFNICLVGPLLGSPLSGSKT